MQALQLRQNVDIRAAVVRLGGENLVDLVGHVATIIPQLMKNAQSINHDLGVRLQALALIEYGIAAKIIAAICEISP